MGCGEEREMDGVKGKEGDEVRKGMGVLLLVERLCGACRG